MRGLGVFILETRKSEEGGSQSNASSWFERPSKRSLRCVCQPLPVSGMQGHLAGRSILWKGDTEDCFNIRQAHAEKEVKK